MDELPDTATGNSHLPGLRLLCIDDHPLFLEGLAAVLGSEKSRVEVTTAATMDEALSHLHNGEDFDLITLDWSLPDAKGGALLRYIRQHQLFIPVLVVSASENPVDLSLAMSSGASGFVSKSLGRQALLEGISQVLAGERYVNAGELERQAEEAIEIPALTSRQLEVLERLGKGWSNKEICASLCLTEHTVKTHVKALFQAFQVKNRTECVRKAQTLGILPS